MGFIFIDMNKNMNEYVNMVTNIYFLISFDEWQISITYGKRKIFKKACKSLFSPGRILLPFLKTEAQMACLAFLVA